MTETEVLTAVKNGLGITGDYHDKTLQVYINDVKQFMVSAGVDQYVVDSETSIGCIMRGVADLWNNGAGNADFSNYFKLRLTQLACRVVD